MDQKQNWQWKSWWFSCHLAKTHSDFSRQWHWEARKWRLFTGQCIFFISPCPSAFVMGRCIPVTQVNALNNSPSHSRGSENIAWRARIRNISFQCTGIVSGEMFLLQYIYIYIYIYIYAVNIVLNRIISIK